MKAKFGAIVVDGRGKIGGHVASKNRSGAYFRTKVTPVNPQTTYQNAARAMLASFSSAWRSLTAAQRAAWDAAVSSFQSTNVFGDLVNPTGKNLYTKLNVNLENAGQSAITSPPVPVAIDEPTLAITTNTAAALTITVGNLNTGQTYLIFATSQVSAGVSFMKQRYRLITRMDGAAAQPYDIHAVYVTKFGARLAGLKIGFKVVPINETTGQNGVGATATSITA